MSERDRPFEQLVAEGVFPEYSIVEKFGQNSDIDNAGVSGGFTILLKQISLQ